MAACNIQARGDAFCGGRGAGITEKISGGDNLHVGDNFRGGGSFRVGENLRGGANIDGGDKFLGDGQGSGRGYGPAGVRCGPGCDFGESDRHISNNKNMKEGDTELLHEDKEIGDVDSATTSERRNYSGIRGGVRGGWSSNFFNSGNGRRNGTGRLYASNSRDVSTTEIEKNVISDNPMVADEVFDVNKDNIMVLQEEIKAEEKNVPLSDQQQAAIDALSSAITERPFPSNLSLESTGKDNSSLLVSSAGDSVTDGEILQAVLVNTVQFYKWFSDLETAMESETEEKYTHYLQILKEQMLTCDNILNQVDSTLALFNDLQLQHQAVVMKTKTLHDACDKLLVEKQQLIEFSDALRNKLNFFDELENFATHFYSPTMSIENENFLPLLKRMDECISYVEGNPQYAESSIYLVKFRQFQSRAFSMIRSHVVAVLKNACSQIQTAVRNSSNGKSAVSEGVEASVIYVRFKAAANEIKPVLVELESRSKRKDYVHTLLECHKLYCEHRLSLVKGIVHQRVSDIAKKEALPSFTRSGCAYLVQFCHLEHKLFEYFFPSSSEYSSTLTQLLDPLCTYFYDTLRPRFIHETNLDLLCELVDILKAEISGEKPHSHIDSMSGLRTVLERILADVHGRLTFRARTHIRDEIANYSPSGEDLDYPGKLEQLASGKSDTISANEAADEYKTWYPPLEKTLSCLLKLYRCLNPTVFTGLAQEAMEVCSNSIQKAGKHIAKKSSPMDGQLFVVKHLLTMREQIAPFDMEFSVTHKELDFSHLLEHLRRILRGQASLFDWSRTTSLARTLSPRVLESQIDAKKDLEKALKGSCEEFIMHVTKIVVDPMLSFVTKVTAVKAWERGKEKVLDPLMEKPIKAHAFANPDKVAEIVEKVNSAMAHHLPQVTAKMKLYLPNSSTRSILFRPIRTNIIEAHAQVLAVLRSSEYTEDEISGTNIISIGDLQLLLDGHLL